jgi:hypothetical protein
MRDQVMTVQRLRIERGNQLDDLQVHQEAFPASRLPGLRTTGS